MRQGDEVMDHRLRTVPRSEALAQRYDGVLEHAPCGIILIDREGRIVRANARAAGDLGYARAELEGQSIEILVPERLRDVHRAHREAFGAHAHGYRAMVGGRGGRTLVARRKDGRDLPVEIGLSALDGGVTAAFVVDVSERVTREQAQRESDARYRALFEHANDAILVVDVDGKVRDCNMNTALRLKSDHTSLIGQSLEAFLDFPKPDACRALLLGALEQGIGRATSVPLRRDGEIAVVDISASPVPIGSERVILVVLHDVTMRDRLQAQILTADRMASLGILAAGAAHEINNPLAAVLLNLDLMEIDLARAAAGVSNLQRLEGAVRDAREAAERVRHIVNDLRMLGRGDDESRVAVDVHDVLDSTIRLASHEMRTRARVTKDYGDVPRVMANEAKLGQVFLNLLVNAAQAISDGRAEEHEIHVVTDRDASGRVRISVSDTGSGIAEHVRKRLFTPFFTTKPLGVGTGLGLSISNRIVTSLGGEIIVETKLGCGSTFRVLLPAA
jgi:PAS domain S-box-containing protein